MFFDSGDPSPIHPFTQAAINFATKLFTKLSTSTDPLVLDLRISYSVQCFGNRIISDCRIVCLVWRWERVLAIVAPKDLTHFSIRRPVPVALGQSKNGSRATILQYFMREWESRAAFGNCY